MFEKIPAEAAIVCPPALTSKQRPKRRFAIAVCDTGGVIDARSANEQQESKSPLSQSECGAAGCVSSSHPPPRFPPDCIGLPASSFDSHHPPPPLTAHRFALSPALC